MTNVLALLIVGFFILLFFAVLVFNLFETREVWNGGISAQSGKPWHVVEVGGDLILDDFHGHRMRLNGVVIHPAITDALRRQKKRSGYDC